jgi:LPS-assembly lipoprotein
MHKFLLSLWLLTLSACGFQPVYQTGAQSTAAAGFALPALQIEKIPGRDGQILQTALEDGLNPQGMTPAEAHYTLSASLNTQKTPVVIELDGRISRFNLRHDVRFSVKDLRTGAVVHRGRAKRVSSYNVALSDFSTFMAERDARKRGLEVLAEQIIMQLAAATQSIEEKSNSQQEEEQNGVSHDPNEKMIIEALPKARS